jgi:hypothetical protein
MRHLRSKRLRNPWRIRAKWRKDTPEGVIMDLIYGGISEIRPNYMQSEIIMISKILICYLYPYLTFKMKIA